MATFNSHRMQEIIFWVMSYAPLTEEKLCEAIVDMVRVELRELEELERVALNAGGKYSIVE